MHGFANRLERTIVIIDVRELAPVLMAYVPGYAAARQLSMLEAVDVLRTSSEQQPIWAAQIGLSGKRVRTRPLAAEGRLTLNA